jgi:PadR family transcriptional regulator PadR
MRRKPGTLLPLEIDILEAGLGLERFHGFELAKALANEPGPGGLTAHGTLYKALQRLEDAGLLSSRWEDPEIAAGEGRPRRRLYQVTGLGEQALSATRARPGVARPRPRLGST